MRCGRGGWISGLVMPARHKQLRSFTVWIVLKEASAGTLYATWQMSMLSQSNANSFARVSLVKQSSTAACASIDRRDENFTVRGNGTGSLGSNSRGPSVSTDQGTHRMKLCQPSGDMSDMRTKVRCRGRAPAAPRDCPTLSTMKIELEFFAAAFSINVTKFFKLLRMRSNWPILLIARLGCGTSSVGHTPVLYTRQAPEGEQAS